MTTISGRRSLPRLDAATILTLFAFLLIVLPARLVVPALGGAGRPAVLLGICAGAWWALERLTPVESRRSPSIVRQGLWIYLLVFALTYAMGYARGLPGDEANATDRALLVTAALGGVALLAADGIKDRSRLDVVLRRLTVAAAVMASVGIFQFVTGVDLARKISIPGLGLNKDLYGIGQRGGPGFNRVAGTAGHPIEFGVVAAMVLPLALHYALFARSMVEQRWRWLVVTLLALAVPFSISRSGIIALVVAMVTLAPIWSRRLRRRALVVIALGTVVVRSAIPGLLGTIRSLFKNAANDPSIQGRTNDYDDAFTYVAARPWFGRGPRTFIPEKYIVLDNQYLNTLITMGYVGLTALVLFFVCAFVGGRQIYKIATDDETRHLGQALAASFFAGALTSFTFDSLAFATFSGCLFLLVGCTAALLTMAPSERLEAPSSGGLRHDHLRRKIPTAPVRTGP